MLLWGSGLGGGEGGVHMSVVSQNFGQLSVKFKAFCQLSVKWLLMINYETYLYIFETKFSFKDTYNVN